MARKTIEERVLTLEEQMSELRELPARVTDLGSQVSQLRAEMRDECSAIRSEMADGLAAVRGEMAVGLAAVRGEVGAVREEMATFRADFIARDDETRRHACMLHEEVIARIALTREGSPRPSRRRKRR